MSLYLLEEEAVLLHTLDAKRIHTRAHCVDQGVIGELEVIDAALGALAHNALTLYLHT